MTDKKLRFKSNNKRFRTILKSYKAQRLTVTIEYGESRRVAGRIFAMYADCLDLLKENGISTLIKFDEIDAVSRRKTK